MFQIVVDDQAFHLALIVQRGERLVPLSFSQTNGALGPAIWAGSTRSPQG
jgi:hypothetical protein